MIRSVLRKKGGGEPRGPPPSFGSAAPVSLAPFDPPPPVRPLPLLALLLLLSFAPRGFAQGMEEFPEVDPHTGGDEALFERLGYVNVGSFLWTEKERTENVAETMGGLDVLFVETPHFLIASSLGTYTLPGDKDEKKKLGAEFDRFEERLGTKWKAPKRELDPWLRMHLFAQRAEACYADFVEAFELPDDGATEKGPHLGQKKKFKLVLCERTSELGRYLRAYEDGTHEYSYRSGNGRTGMMFAINHEALAKGNTDESVTWDARLHNIVVANLVRNFIDGYDQAVYTSPEWFTNGVSYVFARRVDPRHTQTGKANVNDPDHWKWDERVRSYVENEFYTSLADMFVWPAHADLPLRDHMVAWSKARYLLEECAFDRPAFLASIVKPIKGKSGADELRERQLAVLAAYADLTPEEFDEAWSAWAELSEKKRARARKKRRKKR